MSEAFTLPAGATLREYVSALRMRGLRVASGAKGTYWVAFGDGVVQRLPALRVGPPAASEIDDALRKTGGVIASYLVEPDHDHSANSWLYLRSGQDYTLEALPPAMRRNVRRAARELAIAPLTAGELLAHGSAAFCDTRRRNGLDDGTLATFRRMVAGRTSPPATGYLGAWKDRQLAAFVSILHVDDWVELSCASMNSMLCYRPNDALLYAAISHYLTTQSCRIVSFGVSSLQANSKAAGLHRFKRKLGFTPRPVHRAFTVHPSLRPVANRATLRAAHWAVNAVLHLRPRDHRLKKVGGMLACMLGATWMMEAAEQAAT